MRASKPLLLVVFLFLSFSGYSKQNIIDCVLKNHPELMENNLKDMKTAIEEYNETQDDDMTMLSDHDTIAEAVKNLEVISKDSVQGTQYEFCSKLTKEESEAVSVFEEYVACEDNLGTGTDSKVCKDFQTYSKHALKSVKGKHDLIEGHLKKIQIDMKRRGLEDTIALRKKANDALIDDIIRAHQLKSKQSGPIETKADVTPVVQEVSKKEEVIKIEKSNGELFKQWLKNIWTMIVDFFVSIFNFIIAIGTFFKNLLF